MISTRGIIISDIQYPLLTPGHNKYVSIARITNCSYFFDLKLIAGRMIASPNKPYLRSGLKIL